MLKEKISSVIRSYRKDFPAMVCLVGRKGKILYNEAFGCSDMENGVKALPDSRFMIASVSKQFTCMAVMKLKERNLLQYDDEIRNYIGDLPFGDQGITIRHLMTHTSGIPDYVEIILDRFKDLGTERLDIREAIKIIKDFEGLEFQPGTRYSYSNSGYVLLQHIIEQASGEDFIDFMSENIFRPLKMQNTLIPKDAGKVDRLAVGYYRKENGTYEKAPYNYAVIGWADGNIISTAEDLFQWHNALNTERLVKRETLEEAFRPYILKDGSSTDYGFGWVISPGRDLDEVGHSGGTEGFTSRFWRIMKDDTAVILLTNAYSDESSLLDIIYEKILDVLYGRTDQI